MGEVLIVLTKSMGSIKTLLLVFANRYGPIETMLMAVIIIIIVAVIIYLFSDEIKTLNATIDVIGDRVKSMSAVDKCSKHIDKFKKDINNKKAENETNFNNNATNCAITTSVSPIILNKSSAVQFNEPSKNIGNIKHTLTASKQVEVANISNKNEVYIEVNKKLISINDLDISDCRRLIDNNVDNPKVYLRRGELLLAENRYNSSIVDFLHYIGMNPKDPIGFVNIGKAYYYLGNYREMHINFLRASELGDSTGLEFENVNISKNGAYY